ncbi:hypothetical protein [Kordiimonas sp. SCSIO 12610]|uniref:hypothetical protein n=1 Tax=Kordiimonas sp. SCSIO 12610 TaxID=2829597 RepID=UPI00210EFA11|nr:hypothetical protein [Kordiimonas sp. SCSIO 12610]UTW55795.1 hypothetical protein KFF44_02575 [Kordiimonas sp. SCSIO 12610]
MEKSQKSILAKALAPLTAVVLLVGSSTVASADSKNYTPEEAEKLLMKGCLDDKKNDPEQCECVLGGLKRDATPEDYKVMMGFLGLTFSGDFSGIWDFVVKNDMTLGELEKLGDRLEAVTDKLEKECDGVEMNLKLDFGKSTKI